jgi:hypothetical protein
MFFLYFMLTIRCFIEVFDVIDFVISSIIDFFIFHVSEDVFLLYIRIPPIF